MVAHRQKEPYVIQEVPLFHHRPLRAIVIGAGPSGISWHHHASKLGWLNYTIYEKNSDVGGVWLENRYPGCACDIPSPAFQFLFNTHPGWSKFYAPAREIHAYLKATCDLINIWPCLRLNAKVTSCCWDEQAGKWSVQITDTQTGRVFQDSADLLINAGGILNDWKYPNIPGLHSFAGKLMHSANWDESVDLAGKTVAVIGAGSSAIQIVPNIQPIVKHLYSFNRSKTWILPGICASHTPDGQGANFEIPSEEKKRLATDKLYALQQRREIEQEIAGMYSAFLKDSTAQAGWRKAAVAHMHTRLRNDPKLIEEMVPDFHVGCKRPTPGEGYLEALTQPNATLVTTPIARIMPTGLVLADGTEVPVDVLVCATGFNVSYAPKYPVVGTDKGTDLSKFWAGGPKAYFGLCAPGFPNMFHIYGPYAPVAHGSVMPGIDAFVRYILQVAEKMSTCDVKAVEVQQRSVADFMEHAQAWLPRSVWTSGCDNWYSLSGELVVYPGTMPHALEFLKTVRFEDYDIRYRTRNSLSFLGNGTSEAEAANLPVTDYLNEYFEEAKSGASNGVSNGR